MFVCRSEEYFTSTWSKVEFCDESMIQTEAPLCHANTVGWAGLGWAGLSWDFPVENGILVKIN